MKWCLYFVACLSLNVCISKDARSEPAKDSAEAQIARYTRDKWLVILAAERDFYSAKVEAQRVSHLSGVGFSMDGLVFDKRRGLIVPDDAEVDAGEQGWRRYNEIPNYPNGYISIERSDAYPGLRKGYYVVVAAICNSRRDADLALRRFRAIASTAYVAKTAIYMGCIH